MVEGITKLLLSMLGIFGILIVFIGVMFAVLTLVYIIKHFNDMED